MMTRIVLQFYCDDARKLSVTTIILTQDLGYNKLKAHRLILKSLKSIGSRRAIIISTESYSQRVHVHRAHVFHKNLWNSRRTHSRIMIQYSCESFHFRILKAAVLWKGRRSIVMECDRFHYRILPICIGFTSEVSHPAMIWISNFANGNENN